MIKTLRFMLVIPLVILAQAANAAFIVEQYDDFWSTNLGSLITYANNNTASTITNYEYLDFSDTNSNGHLGGFNLWPSDEPVYSGSGAAINDTFFIKATGNFDIAVDGSYNIRTWNDDGVFVYIDGVLQINDAGLHAPQDMFTGYDFLTSGSHSLELYFFENGGGANLEVSISGNNNGNYTLLTSSAAVPEPMSLS